jgi:serine phosphatase RsbU (regulator of sigma subunit)
MVHVRMPDAADLARIASAEKRATLILGKNYKAPVRQEGEVVGQLTPRINPDQVIRRVLGAAEDGIEIPFAVDKEGTIYTRKGEDRATLDTAGIAQRIRSGASLKGIPGWIVSATTDEQSGLRIGVARPVGDNLDELRRTAGRNFILGLGLIAFAMIGIVPLSNHLARDVKVVIEGADRIAQGDLMTRVPEKAKNELGMLARAFNRMAEDLSLQQQQLVVQERARKEQELQQRLLEVEYERYDIAVFTRTATEVGGDYYDFHADPDGALSVTIGDATGHGAKAGTMVTVVKTLFAGYRGETSPAAFLDDAAGKIKRMELGRMSMALSLARLDGGHLTLASAGMPPALVHRAKSGRVDEIALGATPLGTLGVEYPETTVDLDSGDTVLFLTDGFPELMNDAGQQLGYTAALDAFAIAAGAENAAGVIASLAESARRWHGDAPPNDDVTFVVARFV